MCRHTDRDAGTVGVRAQQRFLLIPLTLALLAWLTPLSSSFWLDETITAWITRDGLREVIARSLEFQGSSPLYFVIVWCVRHLTDGGEALMRLPSVGAMLLATAVTYRIARRLLTCEAALVSAISFAALPSVAFAAVDARPYAMALAAACCATLALVRWQARRTIEGGLVYILLSALTVYLHPMFGAMIVVHSVLVITAPPRGGGLSRLSLAGGALTLLALLLPLAPQLLHLAARSHLLGVGQPTMADARFIVFPVALVALIAGITRVRPGWLSIGDMPVVPILTWALLPPLLLALAWCAGANVIVARYLLCVTPAWALMLGWAIASLRSLHARRVVTCVLVVVLLISASADRAFRAQEDWRGAASMVTSLSNASNVLLLVRSGLIETADATWLEASATREYLLAPLVVYRTAAEIVALPYSADAGDTSAYLERLLKRLEGERAGFMVLERVGRRSFQYQACFDARLANSGFVSQEMGRFGRRLVLVRFERRGW